MNIFLYFCNMMRKIPYILFLLISLIACTHKGVSERLDDTDSLVLAEKYDSAYSCLSAIKESTVLEPSDIAHYYLLQTQLGYLTNKPLFSDTLLDIAITYYNKVADYEKLASAYYYKSYRSEINRNYPEAILYGKEAERLMKLSKTNNPVLKYKTLESLAYLNGLCDNYRLQLQYSKKALAIAQETHNNNWIVYSSNNISYAFANLGRYDSALVYVEKTLPYFDCIVDSDKAEFLTNVGQLYKEKETSKAKEYFKKALTYRELPGTYEHLADIYYDEGAVEEAYRLWKKALKLNGRYEKDNLIHNILTYNLKRGNLDEASKNLDEIIAIKDSMLNKLKNDTIKDLQLRFDHEVILRKQEKVTSYWRIGGLAAAVLTLLLTIFIIWKQGRTKEKMHVAQMQINDYANQIRELETSNEDVSEAIKELNKKIKNKLEELSPQLLRGQMLYEQIKEGKIKTFYQWTNNDKKLFVEFYKAIDYRTVNSLMSVKRKESLTTHRLFYLLLKEMGKNDVQIQDMFSISDTAMKVLRSRTKEIK